MDSLSFRLFDRFEDFELYLSIELIVILNNESIIRAPTLYNRTEEPRFWKNTDIQVNIT